MENERLSKIFTIALFVACLLYIIYEIYSRYKDNARRDKEASAILEERFANAMMYRQQAEYFAKLAENPHPKIITRYPWEKVTRFIAEKE